MANPMLPLFSFLFTLMVYRADGTLRLDVNPPDITPGLTDSLTVNCSFSFTGITNMSGIIALIVSKSEVNTSQSLDMVSVNVFSPDNMTVAPDFDGTLSGHMNMNGESYISIVWAFPTADQAGMFRCEVHGMDNFGHPTEMYQASVVTSQQPDLELLTDTVSQLQRHLQNQENIAKNQSAVIDKLSNLAKNQSDEIKKLLLLTNTQAEIISIQQSQLDNQSATITDTKSTLNLLVNTLPFYISQENSGHRYLLFKGGWINATAAARKCEDYGSYLVRINDASENQFIKVFLDQHTGFSYVLINGTDEGHEGNWTFTGTDIDLGFTEWGPTEPDLYDAWNCLAIYRAWQWQWRDFPCSDPSYSYKILCELETMATLILPTK